MWEENNKVAQLIAGGLSNDLSAPEQQELDSLLAGSALHQQLFDQLNSKQYLLKELQQYNETDTEASWKKLRTSLHIPVYVRILHLYVPLKKAVAILVGVLCLPLLWLLIPKTNTSATNNALAIIQPRGFAATLQAGAETFPLPNPADTLARHPLGWVINKAELLVYQVIPNEVTNGKATAVSHTITVPKGGTYKVELADGSQVWLNSGSVLTLPFPFDHNERVVQVTGEAYFEVAKSTTWPFKVVLADSTGKPRGIIEVLGTKFNVSAYTENPLVQTQLLEGKLNITTEFDIKNINTGQQASIAGNGKISITQHSERESGAANWRNGQFVFYGIDTYSLIKQLARLYDLELQVSGNPSTAPKLKSDISFTKNNSIDDVLQLLQERCNIKSSIVGKKMIVEFLE